jgi:hypothetical protein
MNELNSEDIQSARRKGIWFVLLSIIIIFSLVIAMRNLDIGKNNIDNLLHRVSLLPLFLSLICMSLAFFFMGIRWSALLPVEKPPPKIELTALICAGLLLNYAAPGPVGEFGAAWFAHKRYKIPVMDALASGVTARLIGLILACFIGVLSWLFFSIPVDLKYKRLIDLSVLLASFGGIALVFLAVQPIKLKNIINLEGSSKWLSGPKKMLQQLLQSIEHLSDRGSKAFLLSALWSICAHASVIVGIIFAAIALNTTYSIEGLIFTYAITTAAAVLLFALPGSYLGWDALFFGLMVTTCEIPVPDAMAIALIIRVQQFLFMALGGVSLGWLLRSTETQT